MSFAHPELLLLFAVALIWLWRRRRRQRDGFRDARARHWRAAPPGTRARIAAICSPLEWSALCGLGIALAAPGLTRQAVETIHVQRDLIWLLDRSSSMAIEDEDFPESRLVAARDAIRSLVSRRSTDRHGLLAFARDPVWVCPPTNDVLVLQQRLASVKAVPAGTEADRTAIGLALAKAAMHLRKSKAPRQVVVLCTDGENNVEDIPPAMAARLCAEEGVRLYAVALGEQNQTQLQALQQWTGPTGGAVLKAGSPAETLRAAAQIGRWETTLIQQRTTTERRPITRWILVPCLLVLWLVFVVERVYLRRVAAHGS